MLLQLFTLLLATSSCFGIHQEFDICALVEEPMFCTCDEYGRNLAHKAGCPITGKTTSEDLFWRGFKAQRELRELNLRSRETTFLDFFPSFLLKQLPLLEKFVMRDTGVDTIRPDTFSNLSSLVTVDLERNELQVIETNAFSFLPELKELSIAENKIRSLWAGVFFRLPKLQKLHLNENNLTAIQDLTFVELSSLAELDLSSNHLHLLTDRTFVGLRSLTRLDLSRNNLTILNDGVFSGATALTELDLWSNHIEHLNLHALDGLNHLKILKLSHNHIKHLQDNIFKGAPALEVINLNQNRLQTFQEALVAPLHIQDKRSFFVNLRGNQLNCSCDLLWLANLADTAQTQIFRKELHHLKCKYSKPHHQEAEEADDHATQHISKLTAEEFSCPIVVTTTTQRPSTTSTSVIRSTSSSLRPLNDETAQELGNKETPNFYANDDKKPQVYDKGRSPRKPFVQASTQNSAFSIKPEMKAVFLLLVIFLV